MLAEAEPAHGGYRYALDPWPLRVNELASQEIVYDDAYVREREARVVHLRKLQRQWWALTPAIPFLGFLPRRTKDTLHERFGVEPIKEARSAPSSSRWSSSPGSLSDPHAKSSARPPARAG